MTELRRIALSNTNIASMGTSPTNSGTSTPKSNKSNKMEKSASMVNLTEPELFGFFKNDSFVNLTKDLGGSLSNSNSDLDLSIGDDKDIASTIPGSSASTNIIASSSGTANAFQTLPFIVKLVILSSSAFIYNEIIKHINYNHFNENQLVNFPLSITHVFLYSFVSKFKVGNYFTDFNSSEVGLMVDAVFALTLQGLLMASFHPIMDRILPSFLSNRLLSSSPDSKTSSSSGGTNFLNDLIRTCITFLGISYAIRKIEWTSFLQVSIIWSLINPGLWLLLDGTISGFLSSLLVSGICCISIYLQNFQFISQYNKTSEIDEMIALWLWIGSFFFCGIIIFGKIGRGLFGNSKRK